MRFGYPIFLDVADWQAVIIGGGAVASRKARGLVDAGCRNIRVIAPNFAEQMPEQAMRIPEEYHARHLDGAQIIFAATNSPAVNQAVVRDARARGLLFCRADQDELEPGNFINPAVHRDGALAIAVSTGGSPRLTAAVRDHIAAQLPPGYAQMAHAMHVLRPRIIGNDNLDAAARQAIFTDLTSPEAFDVLTAADTEALWDWLCRRHKKVGTQMNADEHG